MRKKAPAVGADTPIEGVADAILKGGMGCVLVTSGEGIVGIVTERDIVRGMALGASRSAGATGRNIMSSPLIVVGPETPVEDALAIMAEKGIRRLPVVKGGGLLGLVTLEDIVLAFAKQLESLRSLADALAKQTKESMWYA
jgi:CBS domain-containing protein